MTDERRFLVAHAPTFWPGKPRAACVPCRVGVYPWAMPEHALTVMVRATLALGESAKFVEPSPFSAGVEVDGSRAAPDDFVPLRPALDLLFTGEIEMAGLPEGGVLTRRATVGLDETLETFVIASGAPGRVPLRPPYTRWVDGSPAQLGPSGASASWSEVGLHEDGFDYDFYQSAQLPMQFDGMPVDVPLVLDGLFEPHVRVDTMLPAIAPRLFFDPAQPEDPPRDILMRLDTILVDAARRVVDLTWRGFLKLPRAPRAACERLVIAWISPSTWDDERAAETWQELLRELPRGQFFWATERSDVLEGKEPPPLSDDEEIMARFASWDQSSAPSPELPAEQRARIAAELAEQREPRKDVLLRHGLDEHTWALEERATLEELSHPPTSPEQAANQEAYARAFLAAQESFKRPVEDGVSAADFARIVAAAEYGEHEKVLSELSLGLGAVFRLERRFREAAKLDPNAALELELELALARERRAKAERAPADEGTSDATRAET